MPCPLTRVATLTLSIRQLKERVTNLRGKHKQIYSLAVKEVDPHVNWAALVEEKLVRPRLRLGRGHVCRGEPHHLMSPSHTGGSRVPMFSDVCVNEESEAQRGAVPCPDSHSRGDEE